MSETMVEAVARAISPEAWKRYDDHASIKEWDATELAAARMRSVPLQDSLSKARVAIHATLLALREPTDGMINAGSLAAGTTPPVEGALSLPYACWQAMIDQAITDLHPPGYFDGWFGKDEADGEQSK